MWARRYMTLTPNRLREPLPMVPAPPASMGAGRASCSSPALTVFVSERAHWREAWPWALLGPSHQEQKWGGSPRRRALPRQV